MSVRLSTCTFCDGGCAISGSTENGKIKIAPANPNFPAICSKASMVDEYRHHPDRLTHPMRNTGQRGSGKWERISWEQALNEIAEKLQNIIKRNGPEAFAVSEMPLNHGYGGITRRFMNYLGSPNYITALELCMGNTFQVHRAVYGGATVSDWETTDCIVYFGQDRDNERWPAEYLKLKAALSRGAKLIEIDPRCTKTAKLADYHLPIQYGTDAALALGWINTIISEELYDASFVENYCTGFEDLKQHVLHYTPEYLANICNISAELIRETARVYATANAAIIPWGVTGDMQVNSTSLLQAQCILRAICGFLGKSEQVLRPPVGFVTNAEVSAFEKLSCDQRAKQLGATDHPLLTFRASALYKNVLSDLNLPYEPDILATSHCAVPSAVFSAMRSELPYPIKAFFSVANNTVMSYAGQTGIIEALMNQDLVVVFENWMTPTAQLADYVLPGDMWAERSTLGKPFDVAPQIIVNEALCAPVEECRSWFYVLKELAHRLGISQAFPWESERDFFDWRLAPTGLTFEDARARHIISGTSATSSASATAASANSTEFLTPSKKVELSSSVLKALGCNPLPSYNNPHDSNVSASEFPYLAYAGTREQPNYNTAFRQFPNLRARIPEPLLFINPVDALRENLAEGDWCNAVSAYGSISLMVHIDEAQPAGTVRIPHGWWKPESPQGLSNALSAANYHNDGIIFPDDNNHLDGPQGVPGLRGSVRVKITAPASMHKPIHEQLHTDS